MRKNNKDYKPWPQYIQDQERKQELASQIATQVIALTAHYNLDIAMIERALTRDLLTTGEAAKTLGLSPRAFLRLRRRHGLEPLYRQWIVRGEQRQYKYSNEQLTRIPATDIQVAKARSVVALAQKQPRVPVMSATFDLDRIRRRA